MQEKGTFKIQNEILCNDYKAMSILKNVNTSNKIVAF